MAPTKSQRKRSRPIQKKSPLEKKGVKIGILLICIVVIVIAVYFLLTRSDEEPTGNPIAVFDTTMGTFKVELFEDKAPTTAGNFISLANDGFYDGLLFHRVIPGFMIQGGDPNGDGTGGPGYTIEDEFHEDLSNVRGTIAMANHGPNTGGSQFFINVVDNTYLDYDKEPLENAHPVFGEVIEGMDIVDAISEVDTDSNDKPIQDVVIIKITIE